MKALEYRAALAVLGLTTAGVENLFGVDQITSRLWATGEQDVPRAVALCLLLMASHNLSVAQAQILADSVDVPLAKSA
ncbi:MULTISPECIES: hypothetical protein [unclassified Rhizobium]|uniref:hypothetical protein n=1 Tax=unclassified Rhizobium TaxID=2613769 RepID=UPI000476B24B|nr:MULTISPECIES: hypothetical protein [unclassified Rhizobium]MBO9122642.1 hypothetical protein [Rhizobium sp. 16-488-2b]MBO9173174.1 hypothetical protein [Rhizobium sp. 16-488-2a]